MLARVGGPLHKLHADLSGGRSVRAVTWYDRGRGVCWLLAAGMHEDFYEYVEELAKTDAHLPTVADVANFEADAPVRLIRRVVKNAKSALEEALREPGKEAPTIANNFAPLRHTGSGGIASCDKIQLRAMSWSVPTPYPTPSPLPPVNSQ